MSVTLTADQLRRSLPIKVRSSINDNIIATINKVMKEPDLKENFRDNIIGFASVLNDGKYKLVSYLNAVKYVSHKLMGSTNVLAYEKTFPSKFQRWVNEGMSDKTISSYVAGFNKTKLVQAVWEQTLISTHVLNSDIHQKAIMKLASLMNDDEVSPKVQCDAADRLLVHLKVPETVAIKVDVGVENKSIDALNNTMRKLVEAQKSSIIDGTATVKQTAHSKLVINN